MIKLVVSDIDGTLLQGSESELSPRIFEIIHALNRHGILFAPASGRQYHSIRRLFAPVAEELYFLCENGADVYGPSAEEDSAVSLSTTEIDRSICDPLIDHILEDPSRSALISGSNISWMLCRHAGFLNRMTGFTRNRYQLLDDKSQIPGPVIKLAAYCENGSEEADAALGPVWRARGLTVSQAGWLWLDFTLANKGTGLQALCGALHIPLSDVMAFGDNYNDMAMLDLAGHPVIMDDSAPALRARYHDHCADVADYLEAFIRAL